MTRQWLILILLVLLVAGAFLGDIYFLHGTLLPAAPYIVAIIIAVFFLPPRMVAALAIYAVALHLLSFWLERTFVTGLTTLYLIGTASVAALAVALSSRMRREVAQKERAEQLQRDLAVERDKLQAILNSVADEVWVADAEGKVSLLNAAVVPGLGFQRPEEGYEPLAELLPKLEILHPNGSPRPVEESPLLRSLRGESLKGEEIVRHLQTGEMRYRQYSSAPVKDKDGHVVGAVSVVRDITERKRAEEAAQRRAAELQAVLDSMVDGVVVVDASGHLTIANAFAKEVLGVTSVADLKQGIAEIPGRTRMRHPDGRPYAPNELATARALAGEIVVEQVEVIRNPRAEGETYLRLSAAPIKDQQGKIVGAVAVVRDVTELTELDRLKDQFIAVAAHELKTPVAIVKGYAQAMLRRAEEPSPQRRRMLEAIDRGADRIDRVVQDLLDISKLHAGRLELEVERIDLPAMVAEIIDRMALTSEKHRIRLVRAEPVVVHADRDRIGQVVTELLNNAIKYSPKGGDIDVMVAVADHEAVVSVTDNGVGIPKERQGRIFQRFYSAHTNTPFDYGGMGVGLYISKEIIARHGGRMWFESREGKGATFYFSLPLLGAGDEKHQRREATI